METNSSSVALVFAGGLVGQIFPSERGRVVGGCVGVVGLSQAERRAVGGCAGHAHEAAARRFVGGCVGGISLHGSSAQPTARATQPSHREIRTAWGEEVLAEAAL